MENLLLHIEYLLLEHDSVAVPGLGVFSNMYISAKEDEDSNIWNPMSKIVRFESSLNHDYSLLLNSYCRKHSIPLRDAQVLLEKESSQLIQTISSGNEVIIGNLGTLRLHEGDLVFAPFYHESEILKNNGFISVADTLKQTTKDLTEKTDKIETKKTSPFNYNKYYYFKINKVAVRVVASLIILTVIALSIFIPQEKRKFEDRASVLPLYSTSQINLKDNNSNLEENINSLNTNGTNISGDDTVSDNLSSNLTENQTEYHIIVGTFRSLAEAECYVEMNLKDGYDLEILPSKTLYRVSAKSSKDKKSLIKVLNSPEFKALFSEAWIWNR